MSFFFLLTLVWMVSIFPPGLNPKESISIRKYSKCKIVNWVQCHAKLAFYVDSYKLNISLLVRHSYLRESLNVTIHLTYSVNLSIMETKKMSHCVHYYIANPPMETIESRRRMSQYIQSKTFSESAFIWIYISFDWIEFILSHNQTFLNTESCQCIQLHGLNVLAKLS